MKLLAINTSSLNADICLKNEEQETCKKFDSSVKHSEGVMVEVDRLLSLQNLKVTNLDALCLVIGPGSFTGIRIGVAISKGFELVNENMKLIPVTAFEFLMHEFFKENQAFAGDYVCVFNALSGKYYIQTFTDGRKNEAKLTENPSEITQFETIIGLYEEKLPFVTHYVEFQPESLLEIAKEKYENKEFADEFIPLYLRKSQAEELEGK